MTQKKSTYRTANERLRKEGKKTAFLSMRVSEWMIKDFDVLVQELNSVFPQGGFNRTKLFERFWTDFSKVVREWTANYAEYAFSSSSAKTPAPPPPKSGFDVMRERMAALPPRKVEPPPMKPTATVPVPIPQPTPIVLPKLVEQPVEVEQVAPVATPAARTLVNPYTGLAVDISQAQIYTPPPRPEEDSTQLPEEVTLSIPDFRLFTKPE